MVTFTVAQRTGNGVRSIVRHRRFPTRFLDTGTAAEIHPGAWRAAVYGNERIATRATPPPQPELERSPIPRTGRFASVIMVSVEGNTEPAKDYAYFYADWIWPSEAVAEMKSMLLFFDGLALALPERQAASVIDREPHLAQPLAERGLLLNLEPRDWMDQRTSIAITTLMRDLLDTPYKGAFREFGGGRIRIGSFHWRPSEDKSDFRDLAEEDGIWTTLGWNARFVRNLRRERGFHMQPVWPPWQWSPDGHSGAKAHALRAVDTSDRFLRELQRRGLADEEMVDGTVRMDPATRHLLLILVAQALQSKTAYGRLRVHPIGNDIDAAYTNLNWLGSYARTKLRRARRNRRAATDSASGATTGLSGPEMYGGVIRADNAVLDIDLSNVPLDEILAFRAEHGPHFRAYSRALRSFLHEVTTLPGQADYTAALRERQAEINDEAADLRRRTRRAFSQRTTAVGLTLVAATWTAAHGGDPIGAFLASLAAATTLPATAEVQVTAYSYLTEVGRQWPEPKSPANRPRLMGPGPIRPGRPGDST